VACAAIIYLVDSGANLGPAVLLTEGFESSTDSHGYVTISTEKARAGYQPIFNTLPLEDKSVQITAVGALRLVLHACARIRGFFEISPGPLFVFNFFAEPSIASAEFLSNQMGYLAREAGFPDTWCLSSIRHSVGIEAVRREHEMSAVQRTLRHSSSRVTSDYALRYPIRRLLEARIKEFQNALQAALSTHGESVLERLGFNQEEGDYWILQAKSSGLGFICNQAKTSESGSQNDADNRATFVFIANEKNLVEVIAVQKTLSRKFDELCSAQPDRTQIIWVDILAFCEAVIGRIRRSPLSRRLNECQGKADQLVAAGFDPTVLGN